MRRKDREVTDPALIQAILDRCTHCRLGLWDGEEVYMVPMNFGWQEEQGTYTLFFHCAGEGRKLDILRKNPRAAFQMDTDYQLILDERPCECSARFASILGTGVVSFAGTAEEKRRGLGAIMEHTTRQTRAWDFPDASVDRVTVLRLRVEKLTCKACRLPPAGKPPQAPRD